MDAASKAFDIAWHYVSTVDGLGEDDLVAQAFLAAHILRQHDRGERRTLALANRAIGAYVGSTRARANLAHTVAGAQASSRR